MSVILLVQYVNLTQAIPISRPCCRGFFGIPDYLSIPIPLAVIASSVSSRVGVNNGNEYYKIASSRIRDRSCLSYWGVYLSIMPLSMSWLFWWIKQAILRAVIGLLCIRVLGSRVWHRCYNLYLIPHY